MYQISGKNCTGTQQDTEQQRVNGKGWGQAARPEALGDSAKIPLPLEMLAGESRQKQFPWKGGGRRLLCSREKYTVVGPATFQILPQPCNGRVLNLLHQKAKSAVTKSAH